MNEAYSMFSLSNPLHPDLFPSIRKFEAEVIRMTANMLHGDSKVCGAITSGGTESIIMAVKAYRDTNPNIKNPEMYPTYFCEFFKLNSFSIVPVTAHAAFDKACEYLRIKLVHIPLNAQGKVDLVKVRKAINKNTILVCHLGRGDFKGNLFF